MQANIIAISAIATLSACTSYAPRSPTDAGAMQASLIVYNERASYTQLTPDYAVTNAHTAKLVDGAVIRSDRYDLAFFKHTGAAPRWGTSVPGDPVTLHGNPIGAWDYILGLGLGVPIVWPDRQLMQSQVIARMPWTEKGHSPVDTIFVSGPAISGYSGGPVVNEHNEVIGIMSARIAQVPAHEYHYGVGDGIVIPASTIWAEFYRLLNDQVAQK